MKNLVIRASDLIKRSAMSICYNRNNNVKTVVSNAMLKGSDFQDQQTPTEKAIYKEMQGIYCIPNKELEIRFSNDYVKYNIRDKAGDNHICEIKSTFIEPIEDYYKASCLLNAAFYKALIMASSVNGYCPLTTAPFEFEANGNIMQEIKVPKNINYILNFGGNKMLILLADYKVFIDYYSAKAIASLAYDTAKQWDNVNYRKTEYSTLRPYIKVENFLEYAHI